MNPVAMTNGLCQCRQAFTIMGIRLLPAGGATPSITQEHCDG